MPRRRFKEEPKFKWRDEWLPEEIERVKKEYYEEPYVEEEEEEEEEEWDWEEDEDEDDEE
jgi:hypothetical protein